MLFGEAKQSTFYFLDNNVFTELKKKKKETSRFLHVDQKATLFLKAVAQALQDQPWALSCCVDICLLRVRKQMAFLSFSDFSTFSE